MSSLKAKAIQGLIWSGVERFGQRALQFIIVTLLARILSPSDFGQIGMISIFLCVCSTINDCGFGEALIQKKKATFTDECSMFYFNIVIGFLLAGMLGLSAPLIASFYHQPGLIPLVRVFSIVLIINSFGLIQSTLLKKKINFRISLYVGLIATVFSGLIGIVLAVRGFGVWSLAGQALCGSLFRTGSLWVLHSWRPRLKFCMESLKEMNRFGSRLFASYMLNTVFDNIYLLVIGRMFSVADLGFYSQAKRIQHMPMITVTGIVSSVTFPVFAAIQDDPLRIKKGLRQAIKSLALLYFPFMIGLTVMAEPIIIGVLTEKWRPAVPWLQLMFIAAVTYPLQSLHLCVLKASGRSDLFLRLEVLKKAIIAIAILATYRHGISVMILGQIFTSIVCYFVNGYYSRKLIKYTAREQVLDIAPCLGISVLMGLGVHAIEYFPITSGKMILIQPLFGVCLYVLLGHLFGLPEFAKALAAMKERVRMVKLSSYC